MIIRKIRDYSHTGGNESKERNEKCLSRRRRRCQLSSNCKAIWDNRMQNHYQGNEYNIWEDGTMNGIKNIYKYCVLVTDVLLSTTTAGFFHHADDDDDYERR